MIEKGWGYVPLSNLVKAAWNYKEDDTPISTELMDKLESNFKNNGQVENILIREIEDGLFEVLNGNHRYDVARRLKMDELFCYNFGKISLSKAQRIAIETNETRFESNQVSLASILVDLASEFDVGELTDTIPFSVEDIEGFDKLINYEFDEAMSEGNSDGPTSALSNTSTIKLDLPKEIAEQFDRQIIRFKKLLYPDCKNPNNVSYVLPVEAMIQILTSAPDVQITKGQ